jgi:hypothetical protein
MVACSADERPEVDAADDLRACSGAGGADGLTGLCAGDIRRSEVLGEISREEDDEEEEEAI